MGDTTQNFFSKYQSPGLYTLTTSYGDPPDMSSVPLAMGMAKEAGFKVYTLFPDKEDGYSMLAASLGSLSDYRRMDEHFSGMPSKALVYVPMEANNKVYASNGRQSFPCAGVFALKKHASSGADILVTYSLNGGLSDGNFSYVGGTPRRPSEEAQDGDELAERKRTIADRVEKALASLKGHVEPKRLELLAEFARGKFIERLKRMGVCSKITQWEIEILLYLRSTDLWLRNYKDCSELFKGLGKRRPLKEKSPLFLEKKRGEGEAFKLNANGANLLIVNKLQIDQQIREALCPFKGSKLPEGFPIDFAKEGRMLRGRCYHAETTLFPLEADKVAELVSEANDWWNRYRCYRAETTLSPLGADKVAEPLAEKASLNVGSKWVEPSRLDDEDKRDAKEIMDEVLNLKASGPKYCDRANRVYQAFYYHIVTNQETRIPDECLAKAKRLLEEAEGDGMGVAIPGRLMQYRPQQTELRFAEAAPQPEGEIVDSDALEREVADLEEKARIMQDKAGKARIEDLKRRKKEAEDIIERSEEILRKLSLED